MNVIQSTVRDNTTLSLVVYFVSKVKDSLILCIRIEDSIRYPSKTQYSTCLF